MYCEKCGKQLNDNDKFCISCGTKVEEDIQTDHICCPNCGSVLNDDDQFCTSCGSKIGYEESTSADFDDEGVYVGNGAPKKQSIKRIIAVVFLFFFIVGTVYAVSNLNNEGFKPVFESISEMFEDNNKTESTTEVNKIEKETTESKLETTTLGETEAQETTPVTTEATTSVTTTKPTTTESTTSKPTTTKPTTTKPTTTKPTTTEATTTKPTTTESTTSKPTTTKPTTTISPKVSISGGSSGGSTLQFTANGNVSNPSYVWSSSNNNVATVSNGIVTAVGEGTAVITVTMNGQCSASKTVKVGINWGSEYTTNSKESESSLKKLVSSRTEWKYYSVVCGSCGYYDYWGTGVRCNQIYSKGCGGSFNNWIYTWSTKDPNSLPFKTADHGVRSYIDANNREWYWTTYSGFNANETRTVYTYKQGSYCISSVS